jgi:AraC-like DNA-binding protein
MIEYINKRMIEWATWCKRRTDGGIGYPSQSSYCNLVQIHTQGGSGRITEAAAALEIEGIIIAIRKTNQAQYDVAYWFYLAGNFTVKRIAQELRCSEVTVYNRLHALHTAVMEALQDIDIAAQDRLAQQREQAKTVA